MGRVKPKEPIMSQSTCRQLTAVLVVITILSNVSATEFPEANCGPLAKLVLKEAAFTGGLIVHADCGDGRLTAVLKQEDHTVVHGLTRNAANLDCRAITPASPQNGRLS